MHRKKCKVKHSFFKRSRRIVNISKVFCVLLTVVLVLTSVPVYAYVQDDSSNDDVVLSEDKEEKEVEEPSSLLSDRLREKLEVKSSSRSGLGRLFSRFFEGFSGSGSLGFFDRIRNVFGFSSEDGGSDSGKGDDSVGSSNNVDTGFSSDDEGNDDDDDDDDDVGGSSKDEGDGVYLLTDDVMFDENPSGNPAKEEDNYDDEDVGDVGDYTIVPESGHISIMGNGSIELDTTLNVDDEFFVTLIGKMFLSTGIESVDFFWNLTSGYFEVDAMGFVEDGEGFVQFIDFTVEISWANPEMFDMISFSVGFLSFDACGHLVLSQGLNEGFLDFEGVFKLRDLGFSVSFVDMLDVSVSMSVSVYLQESADVYLVWDESGFLLDASVSFDTWGELYVSVSDLFLEFEGIVVSADLILVGGSGSFSIVFDNEAEVVSEVDYSRFDFDEQGGDDGDGDVSPPGVIDGHEGHEPGDFNVGDAEEIEEFSEGFTNGSSSIDDIIDNMTGPPGLPAGIKDVNISIDGVSVPVSYTHLRAHET